MAVIFDIKRFSIHDGPGIRTTIFFKGCPLECVWCANPEGQSPYCQMAHFQRKCVGCGSCVSVCKEGCISFNADKPVFDFASCTVCGKCADVCMEYAVQAIGKEWTESQIMEIIEKDRLYYKNSGGGVTVSGGDPLMQAPAVKELLQTCKKKGINTALETSGFGNADNFSEIIGYVDYLLLDIKSLDEKKLKDATKADLNVILGNLEAALNSSTNVIFRYPYIPGFNDKEAYRIIDFAREKNVKEVDLLPYHELGVNKYAAIGRTYRGMHYKKPDNYLLKQIVDYGAVQGIQVVLEG